MIDKNLIEKSLSLCGKEYSDMGIESYCYFLLSPEFIEKYSKTINGEFFFDGQEERVARMFGLNIYRFQSGDEQPLIDLLSKIGN